MDFGDIIDALESKLAECESDANRLRQAIAVLKREREATPTLPPLSKKVAHSHGAANRATSDMMLTIFKEDEREWSISELHDEMLNRGWVTTSKDPVNALRAAVGRLYENAEVARVSPGVYKRRKPLTEVLTETLALKRAYSNGTSDEASKPEQATREG